MHIDASFISFLYFLCMTITLKKILMIFIFHFKCDSVCVLLFIRNFLELHVSVM